MPCLDAVLATENEHLLAHILGCLPLRDLLGCASTAQLRFMAARVFAHAFVGSRPTHNAVLGVEV